jgi:hypothetical protein
MALTKVGKEGITGISNASDATAITITSAEEIGIGTSSPTSSSGGKLLAIETTADEHTNVVFNTANTDKNGIIEARRTGRSGAERFAQLNLQNNSDGGEMRFYTAPSGSDISERMRVNSGGVVSIGTTQTNVVTVDGRHGIVLHHNTVNAYAGVIQASSNGNGSLLLNRDSDDGGLVGFSQNANQEGTISVSGSTISYNAFSGSHWSRLSNNSKPTILKGTIIETIDEMCDWYQARFEIQEEGETRTVRQSIALPSDASVGDTLTVTFEDNSYTATIIKEADNKHTKCKISDTADSTRVYGVFADWDNDDDTVNDMYVTAVGTHVVRIHSSATVSAGDLLTSNGDGTAKVQGDDIIRSKTIGKVLTNIKQETYDDGSYIVPCALYCG